MRKSADESSKVVLRVSPLAVPSLFVRAYGVNFALPLFWNGRERPFCLSRPVWVSYVGTQDHCVARQVPLSNILRDHSTLLRYKSQVCTWTPTSSTQEFHIAHFHGCATLFSKNTFESDLEVKSIFVPGNTTYCRELPSEAVITQAHFRRVPKDGKAPFTMISLHCDNEVAKRRSIPLNVLLTLRTAMIEESVDLVAGDLNGASWRRKVGNEQRTDSILEKAFSTPWLALPPGQTPLWLPGGIPHEWTDVCGFVNHQIHKKYV